MATDANNGVNRETVEEIFGELAVARGLLTMEQLAACQWARDSLRDEGKRARMGEVMMAKGLITKAQALELLKAAHQSLGHHQRIGGYELLEKLGEGAMGAVYRAKQLSMDRIVALKLLPRAFSRNPEALDRFLREARIVARLNHPNIIRGFEVGEGNGYHYFAMEFVDGGTVGDRLDREGALPEPDVLDIGLQTAEALGHAHEAGVIHRDVKPDNIMVGSGGIVKLADLGLATRTDAKHITQTGSTIGTPYYMSPEQVAGAERIDARADIYALGASLYHLSTGCPPFDGISAPAIMTRRLREDPTPACNVSDKVSPGFTAVLMKMMAREPDDRYANCDELADDLRAILDGEAPSCIGLADGLQPDASEPKAPAASAAHAPRRNIAPDAAPARRALRLPQPPRWLTPARAGLAALLLGLILAAVYLGQRWDRFAGPSHPADPDGAWFEPPDPQSGGDAEAREHWQLVREFLDTHRDDPAAQADALRDLAARHPGSPYAHRARRLLQDLGPAAEADAGPQAP